MVLIGLINATLFHVFITYTFLVFLLSLIFLFLSLFPSISQLPFWKCLDFYSIFCVLIFLIFSVCVCVCVCMGMHMLIIAYRDTGCLLSFISHISQFPFVSSSLFLEIYLSCVFSDCFCVINNFVCHKCKNILFCSYK